MNLNTVVEVKRPGSADEIDEWRDGYAWLAGGTWLFGAAVDDRHAHRPRGVALAGAAGFIGRPRDRGHLSDCRALSFRGAGGVDRRAAPSPLLRFVAGIVQDLERGHGRRQHLHVLAGRPDDLAYRRIGSDLHAVAA